ncbi:tyrosine-type recombinase/integrase [Nonomuraea sp. NPDC048881]|uniref:tyrosine-type recombinase/integrase n=1 Tax=Nonomuraea sp. NPDC048881 TaxID=3155030 RepID=UPI0033FE93EA
MFATKHGSPIEHTEDWKIWKPILQQAGVQDVRVHDARHTAATLLIEHGVNIRIVQQVLGHTRVTTPSATPTYPHPWCATRASSPPLSGEIPSRCDYDTFGDQKGPLPDQGRGPSAWRRIGDLNPGWCCHQTALAARSQTVPDRSTWTNAAGRTSWA